MSDELKHALSAWASPALSASARERVEELLQDPALPGPIVRRRTAVALLPLTYGAIVTALVVWMLSAHDMPRAALTQHHIAASAPPVIAPGLPADAHVTATAVSIVNLQGYEPVRAPRVRVVRSQP